MSKNSILSLFDKLKIGDESKDPLDKEDLRLTLIAALFKDVNHGCGSCSDRSNVTRAVLTLS